MSLTPSNMLPLGTQAPAFNLPDVTTDGMKSLEQLQGETATVVMFICNHCPYVKHIFDELVRLGNDYKNRGIGLVAISANDVDSHPEDRPDKMRELAEQIGLPFPYLYDQSQAVARAYDAACTPDFYVFDADMKLAYRGQLDGSRPGNNTPNDGHDLRAAIDALLDGKQPADEQTPSTGCNIKWREEPVHRLD